MGIVPNKNLIIFHFRSCEHVSHLLRKKQNKTMYFAYMISFSSQSSKIKKSTITTIYR